VSDIDVSLILALRDQEAETAAAVRAANEIAQRVVLPEGRGALATEILALDQRSGDNTLSVLSILHAKLPQLRTIQGLDPGTATMRAARTAEGRVWLLVDAPFDAEHGLWAARQVFCGDRAAIVPGEVLAVHRNLGQAALGWLDGGLVSAQHEVEHMLESHGQRPAWSPPRQRAFRDRAKLFVRGQLGRLGFGQYDRRS
jgi:hypothetical protein